MSVCSGRTTHFDGRVDSIESKRQSSTFDACSEKIAKFTPAPSHVAPSGYGRPGHTLIEETSVRESSVRPDESGCSKNRAQRERRKSLRFGGVSRTFVWRCC